MSSKSSSSSAAAATRSPSPPPSPPLKPSQLRIFNVKQKQAARNLRRAAAAAASGAASAASGVLHLGQQGKVADPERDLADEAALHHEHLEAREPEREAYVKTSRSGPETEAPSSLHKSVSRFESLMGDTPLVELTHMVGSFKNPNVRVFGKLEYFNPGHSIKDRIVYNIVRKAERDGRLRPGMTVVAASSGNTGASTAMVCAMKGLQCIITTSPKCSKEKMDAIRAYGARLLVSPPGAKEGSPDHYMEMARLMALEEPERFFDMDQYETKSNPEGHYLTLGPEILDQTHGNVTHFVAAGSTGGTISGTGGFLKEHVAGMEVVLADPVGSIFAEYFRTGSLEGVEAAPFLVEGVGKGSIPGAMDFSVIDAVEPVSDQQAFDMCHQLARTQGICAGGSSGLNVFAALQVASRCTERAVVVTVLPDLGLKYLSKIYCDAWLLKNGLRAPAPGRTTAMQRLTPDERLRLVDEDVAPESSSSFAPIVDQGMLVEGCLYRDLVGDTPLVDLSHLVPSNQDEDGNPRASEDCEVKLLAKLECFNPSFSIKDRIVQNILDKAEQQGRLRPGMTIVAASSGNTGASCAMMAAMRGHDCIITTSPKCSTEKMDAIRAYGARLLVSPPGAKEGSPDHYMEMARLMALEEPDRFFDMDQYETQSNPEGHYLTLGPEIWEQTQGRVTHFVAAGSTGGTISGTGAFLKEQNGDVNVVLADPVGSIFSEYFRNGKTTTPGKFLVEGVGKGSIPGAMNFGIIDAVEQVSDKQAFDMCHRLARTQGICAGGSAGLNVFAALEVANKCTEPAVIVTVLPDLGIKYLSKVYNDEWLAENGLLSPSC